MQPSLFTKIIDGELPSFKVYEDERTFAFLDIHPIQYGQTIVVPKAQVDHFEDLEPEDYEAVMNTVKKLSLHIRDELQAERVCVVIEGFEVPHAHVKLIPCDTADDLKATPEKASDEDLQELIERLVY